MVDNKQRTGDVIHLRGDSNAYCIIGDEPILIDTGDPSSREQIFSALDPYYRPDQIRHVIFTHLHYDHVANWENFTNATFYAHPLEIEAFQSDPYGTVLEPHIAHSLKRCEMHDITRTSAFHGFLEVLHTPGHTMGSIIIAYPDKHILFTGDTLFRRGLVGRTDLPTSRPDKLSASLDIIASYKKYDILPGHDY